MQQRTSQLLVTFTEAVRLLLKASPPGMPLSMSDRFALAELIGKGWNPIDAVEQVRHARLRLH